MNPSPLSQKFLERESTFPAPKRRPQPLLSPSSSLSSSSSSLGFSYFSDTSPRSPATPLQFSRVPFSWEKLPGIPKKQTPVKKMGTGPHGKRDDSSSLKALLPLPPPNPSPNWSSRRFQNDAVRPGRRSFGESARMDPFFAALVECSKDDDDDDGGGERDPLQDHVWKARNSSDLFGSFLNFHVSCKRACAVSESIVYLPRQAAGNSPATALSGLRRR